MSQYIPPDPALGSQSWRSRVRRRLFVGPAVLTASLFLLACPASIAAQDDPDLDSMPGLAEPPAEPFALVPSILTDTGKLLIDRAHHNDFIVSGFMNYLASNGWTITEHATGAITESTLAGQDILLIPIHCP